MPVIFSVGAGETARDEAAGGFLGFDWREHALRQLVGGGNAPAKPEVRTYEGGWGRKLVFRVARKNPLTETAKFDCIEVRFTPGN